jgi:undecaprenyl-diphosphatase
VTLASTWLSSEIEQLDTRCLAHLYGGPHGGNCHWAVIAISVVGGGWGMVGLLPLFASARSRPLAASLSAVLLTTTWLVFCLKRIVGRVRPCNSLPGIRALWDSPTDYSFPSGHTTGSFAFAAFVVTYVCVGRPLRPIGIIGSLVGVAFATAVGVSRIYLGVHFPSDVAGSALLGIVLGVGGAHLRPRSGK